VHLLQHIPPPALGRGGAERKMRTRTAPEADETVAEHHRVRRESTQTAGWSPPRRRRARTPSEAATGHDPGSRGWSHGAKEASGLHGRGRRPRRGRGCRREHQRVHRDEHHAQAADRPAPARQKQIQQGGAWIRPRGAQIRPTAGQFAGEGRW
jgi:hypothetical protein